MSNYVWNGPDSARTHQPRARVDRITLRDALGESVSLHRYNGRWLVLRVSETPDSGLLSRWCRELDGVAMSVVVDEAALPDHEHCSSQHCACMVDDGGSFSRWFPALQWPATFVINPHGKLVAILTDETSEPFLRSLVRRTRSTSSFGAVDLGEIDV